MSQVVPSAGTPRERSQKIKKTISCIEELLEEAKCFSEVSEEGCTEYKKAVAELKKKLSDQADEVEKLKTEMDKMKEAVNQPSVSKISEVKASDLKKELTKLKREKRSIESKRDELQAELDAAKKSTLKMMSFQKQLNNDSVEPKEEELKIELEKEKEKREEAEKVLLRLQKLQSEATSIENGGKKETTDYLFQGSLSSLEVSRVNISVKNRLTGGGFAQVYEGKYYEEKVAIKQLLNQSLDGKRELLQEASLLNLMRSEFVVNLYAIVTLPPYCMILEYFPKGSLSYLLWDKAISLPWEKRWSFARDAALALNFLHSQKPPVLHRDIKSANFLVSDNWRLKITDFGCAVFKTEKIKDDKTKEFIGGTINWTAPEILEEQEYTERADVYSYAMLLYEIATRETPWKEYSAPKDQLLIKKNVCAGKRPPLPSDVPGDFKKLVSRCWEQFPASRVEARQIIIFLKKKGVLELHAPQDDVLDKLLDAKAKSEAELKKVKQNKTESEHRLEQLDKQSQQEIQKKTEAQAELIDVKNKYRIELESKRALERYKEEQERRIESDIADLERKKDELEIKLRKEKKKFLKLSERDKSKTVTSDTPGSSKTEARSRSSSIII